MITQWGRQGITFTRSGIGPGDGPYLNDPAFRERKEEFWKHQMVYLDAAASAGAYVLIQTGFDQLASCMSGWMEPYPHGCQNKGSTTPCTGVAQKDGCWKINPHTNKSEPVPAAIARVEDWVWDAVNRTKNHPAVAGFYACDGERCMFCCQLFLTSCSLQTAAT